jgi:DeoR family fructose operon transcriptional repressor
VYATERQQLIEQLITTEGRVVVVDLARRFGVTTETVRRDLDQLESAGSCVACTGSRRPHPRQHRGDLLRRAHSASHRREARHRGARAGCHRHPRRRIGIHRRGHHHGRSRGTAGSARHDVAPARGGHPLDDGRAPARRSAGAEPHGDRRPRARADGRRGGAQTVDAISRLRPDLAFIGTNGLSAAFGLSTPDPDEAAVKRAVIASARRIVVLADAEKFDGELLVSFGRLADLDILVTDAEPPADLVAALGDADVEVWIA